MAAAGSSLFVAGLWFAYVLTAFLDQIERNALMYGLAGLGCLACALAMWLAVALIGAGCSRMMER